MSPTTRSKTATPSPVPAPQAISSQGSCWRCAKGDRLHREGTDCTADTPPTDPMTPAKWRRMLGQNNAFTTNSQATQPTPSGPPRQRPQTGDDQTDEQRSMGSANFQQVDNDNDNGHQQDDDSQELPPQLSRTPDHDPSERIPETPLGPGVDLPSSPPLPHLTAEYLSRLAQQATAPDIATSSPADDNTNLLASPAAPAPSPSGANNHNGQHVAASSHSVTSSVRDLIARQAVRIHTVGEQLETANGALGRVSARCRLWRNAVIALVVLCLAYLCCCCYNSADFEFINTCRRDWYGL